MKPKEMTIALMSPKRNQLLIDATVAAVYKFAVENAGLDKLVIEVRDSSELEKKDETIQKLTKALEFYADDNWGNYDQEFNVISDSDLEDMYGDSMVIRGGKLAREVLKEVRPEPLIIIDEVLKGDDDGK